MDLIKHIVLIGFFGLLIVLSFFYVYMPLATNHGESITVPDIVGLGYEDLDEYLTDRNLRFEVNIDSGYSSDYPPKVVLKQYPEAGQKVKEDRKIFLTLNAMNPPDVKMPMLVDGSLKNAETVLESLGLLMGDITYQPDPARNAVLDQLFKGNSIEPGTPIAKGSKIDLVIGDGIGRQVFEMPDARGLDLEEAKILILGSSLEVGEIVYIETNEELPGIVFSQSPLPGRMVKVGRKITLYVSGDMSADTLDITQ